jgi:hypothetical protein
MNKVTVNFSQQVILQIPAGKNDVVVDSDGNYFIKYQSIPDLSFSGDDAPDQPEETDKVVDDTKKAVKKTTKKAAEKKEAPKKESKLKKDADGDSKQKAFYSPDEVSGGVIPEEDWAKLKKDEVVLVKLDTEDAEDKDKIFLATVQDVKDGTPYVKFHIDDEVLDVQEGDIMYKFDIKII